MKIVRSVRRFQLTPKITLVVEENPGAVSTALGFWVGCGSRHEPKRLQGVTHMAEHMFFKGTSQHSAEEISQIIEMFGGDLNAFTDRENTCFHAWMPAEQTQVAFNLISEMLFDSLFEESDFQKERSVVVQEIKGYEDSPDEEFGDGMWEIPWGDHPLGRRVAGFSKQIKKLKGSALRSYIEDSFLAAPMVVSVASPLPALEIKAQLEAALRRARGFRFGKAVDARPHRPAQSAPVTGSRFAARSRLRSFESDQVQMAFHLPAISVKDRHEPAWSAVSTLLGGGSASALFREVREERGLAYTTYASLSAFTDGGLLSIVLATDKKKYLEAARLCGDLCRRFAAGLTDGDLRFVKGLMEGSAAMSFEGIHNRMESLGRQQLALGRTLTLGNARQEIRALKLKDLNRVAARLTQTPCAYILGPVTPRDLGKVLAAWEGKSK